MGYTTDFEGEFAITPPLEAKHVAYLNKFAYTRRMARDATITATRPDPHRQAVGLPIGIEGCYYVGEGGFAGQGEGDFCNTPADVTRSTTPPIGQPGPSWA